MPNGCGGRSTLSARRRKSNRSTRLPRRGRPRTLCPVCRPRSRMCPASGRAASGRRPRIGVCALNPHASDGGLFGDEEARIITPAVESAKRDGVNLTGPIPSDALWVRAAAGEFDGVVAMYHDQGHIAMKMRSGKRAVNITAGLPIVRTSVAHGTAYDIAGRGIADPQSLIEAARVAVKLVSGPFLALTHLSCGTGARYDLRHERSTAPAQR